MTHDEFLVQVEQRLLKIQEKISQINEDYRSQINHSLMIEEQLSRAQEGFNYVTRFLIRSNDSGKRRRITEHHLDELEVLLGLD